MKKNGFTLVELIVTIGIISLVSFGAMVILNPTDQFKKANDSKRKADLSQIQKALESYYEDRGAYPDSSVDYKISVPDGAGETTIEWGSSWQPYMNILPKSPAGTNYVYYSNGQSYYLYASLDRETDSQACNGGAACTGVGSGPGEPDLQTACARTCNYGVSSPNVGP